MVADCDAVYTSKVFQTACALLNLRLQPIPTFSHYFNFVEVAINGIKKRLLTLMARDQVHDWEKQYLIAIHAVNNSPMVGSITPHQIFLCRENTFQIRISYF